MVNMRYDKYIYLENSVYRLTQEDIKKLKEEYTPIGVVQSRVDAGWNVKDAIRLNKRFVIKDGEFKARIRGNGKMAYLSESVIELFREQGVTFKDLDRRIKNGTNLLKEADETVDWKAAKLEREDREREEQKVKKAKEDKRRKEKARLDMIKRARCSSKYFRYLAQNKIASIKKDQYGNTQLI
ncbi:hypothetical protein [Staphylococcus shinii]|uniref:hypothetical protein n=1 Tax=Staphylococcus shinii TaxID=2912228 RepID=UPI00298F2270|nr:hypothetical protein [Staphylococcus shinii]MDW8564683.1 hypothetical protein [Staphylococcus shinii]